MIAIDHAQPAPTKHSIFRQFSRKSNDSEVSIIFSPGKLDSIVRQYPVSPASSPPTTPRFTEPWQLPRLTKDKRQRRDFPITLFHPFDIPMAVQDRLSRESSQSRSSSSSSNFSTYRNNKRVIATSLPTTHFFVNPKIAPWTLYLPPVQVHALYMGHLPCTMDNKHFIYSEGPDLMGKLKVHFHQRTGIKVAELFVVMDTKGEGAGKIVGVKWDARMSSDEATRLVRSVMQESFNIELEP